MLGFFGRLDEETIFVSTLSVRWWYGITFDFREESERPVVVEEETQTRRAHPNLAPTLISVHRLRGYTPQRLSLPQMKYVLTLLNNYSGRSNHLVPVSYWIPAQLCRTLELLIRDVTTAHAAE